MHKIVTPVSHLFFNKKNAEKISKHSAFLEIRYRTINLKFQNEKFFHCDEDLTLPWSIKLKKNLEQILKKKKNLRYLTFQSTRCCADEKLHEKIFRLSGKKFNKIEMLNQGKKNTLWLRQKFGDNFIIGLENNNYYPTKAYDIITDAGFISQVVRENNLFFLFDLAHAQVTASNQNVNYEKYLEKLPLDLMMQIHICRPKINKKMSYDAHNLPNKKMLEEVKFLANKYKKLKFFTIEYYKDTEKLVQNIKDLRSIINI